MGLSHEVKYIQDIVCKKDLNYYTLYRFSWCDSPFLMQFWETSVISAASSFCFTNPGLFVIICTE